MCAGEKTPVSVGGFEFYVILEGLVTLVLVDLVFY